MISAIVVNYHCHALTAQAVASVLQDMPEAQVIVIDNSESEREAAALAACLPHTVILRVLPRNVGFGRACNLALADARHEHLMLLNPDAFVVPGCLARLSRALSDDERVAAVSPAVYWDPARCWRLPPSFLPTPWTDLALAVGMRWRLLGDLAHRRYRRWVWRSLQQTGTVRQSMLSGGNMMIRASLLERVGGLFDPAFFMYYEDTDLCRRITVGGLEMRLVPQAYVVHRWQHSASKHGPMLQSAAIYGQKHHAGSSVSDIRGLVEERFPALSLPTDIDLGVLTSPPAIKLPPNWPSAWLAELSPSPLFVPAAFHQGQGNEFVLPLDLWRCLGAGDYWLSLSAAHVPPVRYRWQIRT